MQDMYAHKKEAKLMASDNPEQRAANKQAVTSAIEQALLTYTRARVKSNKQRWNASPQQRQAARDMRVVDPVDGDVSLPNGVRQAWLDERDTYNHGIMRVTNGNLVLMPQCEGEDVDPLPAKEVVSHKELRLREEAAKMSDDELDQAAAEAQRQYEEAILQLAKIQDARKKR